MLYVLNIENIFDIKFLGQGIKSRQIMTIEIVFNHLIDSAVCLQSENFQITKKIKFGKGFKTGSHGSVCLIRVISGNKCSKTISERKQQQSGIVPELVADVFS